MRYKWKKVTLADICINVNDKSLHNPTPGIILKLAQQYDMKRKCPYTRRNEPKTNTVVESKEKWRDLAEVYKLMLVYIQKSAPGFVKIF